MSTVFSVESEWLGALSKLQPKAAELLSEIPRNNDGWATSTRFAKSANSLLHGCRLPASCSRRAAKLQSKLHGTFECHPHWFRQFRVRR